MPPPAVILGTPVVHAEGGTTGVSGIQWLLQVAPTVVSPQPRLSLACPGLIQPSRRQDQSRRESTPPAVRIKVTPVVHAEGGDWGGGNPVALASSTYCRFTSARLAPAPVRIKEGGAAPSRRQDQSRRESSKKESSELGFMG